ncbi:MAG: hypothetical protein VCC01_01510 [Candidatus Hydrogenedentota bacterium]
MIESMLQSTAQWLDAEGPNADIVLSTQCRLLRNLADYPFPGQCTPEEKKTIEASVLAVLGSMNFMADGHYYTLPDIDETEAHVLHERRLISQKLIESEGPRGIYIREDQSFSLSINDSDHLALVSLASGQQLQDIWNSTSLTDDTLAGILDFAFDSKHGYLTSHLANTGTGLQFSAVLHLPALTMNNEMSKSMKTIPQGPNACLVRPEYSEYGSAIGDFFHFASVHTLGQSELETLYHFTQTIEQVVRQEKDTRKQILDTDFVQLEDRIERALALARNARLLAFDEGLGVLSSLRLGVSTGLLKGYTLSTLNETGVIAQDAHIRLNYGDSCDDNICNTQRAYLFRDRFAEIT